MAKEIRAFLINVETKKVEEVTYDGTLEEIYKLLDCDFIDRFYLDNDACVYVDDEGFFTDKRTFQTNNGVYVGNGLVVGTNFDTGETISIDCPIEDIINRVYFPLENELWVTR